MVDSSIFFCIITSLFTAGVGAGAHFADLLDSDPRFRERTGVDPRLYGWRAICAARDLLICSGADIEAVSAPKSKHGNLILQRQIMVGLYVLK
jgi:hypothetical protein